MHVTCAASIPTRAYAYYVNRGLSGLGIFLIRILILIRIPILILVCILIRILELIRFLIRQKCSDAFLVHLLFPSSFLYLFKAFCPHFLIHFLVPYSFPYSKDQLGAFPVTFPVS